MRVDPVPPTSATPGQPAAQLPRPGTPGRDFPPPLDPNRAAPPEDPPADYDAGSWM